MTRRLATSSATTSLRLTYTAHDMVKPFARDLGYDGPPFIWVEEQRFHLLGHDSTRSTFTSTGYPAKTPTTC